MTPIIRIVVIIVIIIVILILVAAASRDDRRGGSRSGSRNTTRRSSRGGRADFGGRGRSRSRRDNHPEGCCDDPDCCAGGDRPHAPRDLCCDSDEPFTATVNWKPSASHADHYRIYVKYLDECEEHHEHHEDGGNAPVVPPPTGHRRHHSKDNKSRSSDSSSSSSSSHSHRRHGHVSISFSESSSSSSESPDCGCGPDNYDRMIKVAGCDTEVVLTHLRKKAICVTATAVSRCGRESKQSNCCTTCVSGKCVIRPCIVESDCRGLALRWKRVDCATCINVYYDNELMFTLPGDAGGVTSLPPIENTNHVVTVTASNEMGESRHYHISKTCACEGKACGKCQTCHKPEGSCGCKKKQKSRPHSHSDSSSSSSSSDSHRSHH